MSESAVSCPQCGSRNILDLTAFENHVDWAKCQDCHHDFAYDMPTTR